MISFQFIGTGLSSKNTYSADVDILYNQIVKEKTFGVIRRSFVLVGNVSINGLGIVD
jgi:hypothetical protein